MLKEYKCVECGETDPVKFDKTRKSLCAHCTNKRDNKVYRDRKREYQAEYYKKWYAERGRKRKDDYADVIYLWKKNHPDAIKARNRVCYAIRTGKLDRPLICSICGRQGKISAHHNNYSIPFEICWVCSSCHKKIHLGLI